MAFAQHSALRKGRKSSTRARTYLNCDNLVANNDNDNNIINNFNYN